MSDADEDTEVKRKAESGDEEESLGSSDLEELSLEKRLEIAKADAKSDFEEERDAILKSIPSSYSEMFGQIGFFAWSKSSTIPVLILNPFHVPPGGVRDQWLHMYEKMKAEGRLENMSYLIYFYGARRESDFYYFLPQSKFISYEKEAKKTKKSVAKLPVRLQKKVDAQSQLTSKDEETVRAYTELEEDLLKDPADRRRGVMDFPEGYEMLQNKDLLDVGIGSDGENLDTMEEDEPPKKRRSSKKSSKVKEGSDEETPKKAKKPGRKPSKKSTERSVKGDAAKKTTKKRGRSSQKDTKASKKRKQMTSDDDEQMESLEQDEKTYLPVIRKWKTAIEEKDTDVVQGLFAELEDCFDTVSGRFMKQHALKDLLQLTERLLEAAVDLDQFKSFKQKILKAYTLKMSKAKESSDNKAELKTKSQKSKQMAKNDAAGDVSSGGIGEEEEDSGSDAREQDYIEGELSSHDEEDDDFQATTKKRSKSVAKSKAKPSRSKKDEKKKEKVSKKSQKTKHKVQGRLSESQKRKKEQQAFEQCEKEYLPLVNTWKSALQASDVEQVQKQIAEADTVVANFSASFLLEYDLSGIVKETKHLLKRSNGDLSALNALRVKLKDTYNEKVVLVPKKFKPTRSMPVESVASKQGDDEKKAEDGDDAGAGAAEAKPAIKTQAKTLEKPKSPPVKSGTTSSVSFAKSPVKKAPNLDSAKTETSARSASAPQRKKFSLGSLMASRPSETSLSRGGETSSAAPEATAKGSAFSKQEKKPIPAWVKGPATIDAPTDELRSFALEFLLQMAAHFPAGKVDVDSVARSLEASIFDWAKKKQSSNSWSAVYWEKVHAIVAAVCGKREAGSLMNLVVRGSFDTPDKIVALTEDKLVASFEGRPLYL